MRATARVLDVRDGRALLSCDVEAAACDGCRSGRGCALRWLARSEGARLEVPDTSADGRLLAADDGVALEVSDGELLRATALAYVPPLAGLLAGSLLERAVSAGGDGVSAVIAAAVGLALGWGASRAWLRRSPPRYKLRVESR